LFALSAQGDSSSLLAIIGWLSRIVAAPFPSASWLIHRDQRKPENYGVSTYALDFRPQRSTWVVLAPMPGGLIRFCRHQS